MGRMSISRASRPPVIVAGVKRGSLMILTLCAATAMAAPALTAAPLPAADTLLGSGEYARAFAAATQAGDAVTASRAAAAMTEYRAAGPDWTARAVNAGRQAVSAAPGSADSHLALGSALGIQARAGGYTLSALNTARQARAALERALSLAPERTDIQAILAEWHAGAWAKAGAISGGNAGRARDLATRAARAAPDSVFVQAHAGIALSLIRDPQARAVLNRAVTLPAQDSLDRDTQTQVRGVLGRL
ncbi:hypothetical protein GCM10008961_37760 [Deinococcus knuensis]|uniref:Tetratricopeptide repeat protein n=1 Tax=Deinococcus knuensis TaxID=1837380 RepID=A0ABQ2SZ80_9DEIO|nr:hypothetical protein GCM10008961_37760 [Deinococcus knuensis]